MVNIVCFMGGACGDIVTAVIDPKDAQLDGNRIKLPLHRQLLKKPHLYKKDSAKNEYIDFISNNYKSIPSHDTDFHIRNNHKFITIEVNDIDIGMWAAERFQKLHSPHVWDEMMKASNYKTVKDYAQALIDHKTLISPNADMRINLKDIVDGKIQNYFDIDEKSKVFYQQWLNSQ